MDLVVRDVVAIRLGPPMMGPDRTTWRTLVVETEGGARVRLHLGGANAAAVAVQCEPEVPAC